MSPRPKGRTSTSDMKGRIIATAWEQIAQEGAAALSLRAIARALNIAAPSIYNYFPDRDALVTSLIVDAFNSMGDAQFNARQGISTGSSRGLLMELGLAYRQWATTYPQRYQLIFGTPLPGYTAPQEITDPAASRSLIPLIDCMEAAFKENTLRLPDESQLSPELIQQLNMMQSLHPVSHYYVIYAALMVWSRVHGLVSLEIGNQFPAFIQDTSAIYQHQLDQLVEEYLKP